MSIEALIKMHHANARGRAQAVLWWLADAHNGKTGQCNPSIATLARKTGRGEATIKRALKDLKEKYRDIAVLHFGFGGFQSGMVNHYELTYMRDGCRLCKKIHDQSRESGQPLTRARRKEMAQNEPSNGSFCSTPLDRKQAHSEPLTMNRALTPVVRSAPTVALDGNALTLEARAKTQQAVRKRAPRESVAKSVERSLASLKQELVEKAGASGRPARSSALNVRRVRRRVLSPNTLT